MAYFQAYRLQNMCFCKCLKSDVFVHLRTVNMLKGSKHCKNLYDSSWIAFVHHSGKYSVGKSFFLVISNNLRPFVNTLTPDEKSFLGNSDTLREATQIKLSKKLRIFCQFSTLFPKSIFNFKHFEKKMRLIACVFPKL